MTDTELIRALEKEDNSISWPDFNKILLELEIYGLIRVSWVTRDKRRIEVAEGRHFHMLLGQKGCHYVIKMASVISRASI